MPVCRPDLPISGSSLLVSIVFADLINKPLNGILRSSTANEYSLLAHKDLDTEFGLNRRSWHLSAKARSVQSRLCPLNI